MQTNREKASYCIGLEMGGQLREQFHEMDVEFLTKGVHDGFAESKPALPTEEVQKILQAIRSQVENQQKQFIAKLAEENKKKGEAFLENNKKQEGIQVLASGLQYKVLKAGNGATPTTFDNVKVHYRGYFIDGTEFDSSYKRGEPHVFPVGRVIPGWVEALQLMKVGDQWRLFVPSYLAYGEMGFAPDIEPNVTLLFDMELLAVNED